MFSDVQANNFNKINGNVFPISLYLPNKKFHEWSRNDTMLHKTHINESILTSTFKLITIDNIIHDAYESQTLLHLTVICSKKKNIYIYNWK